MNSANNIKCIKGQSTLQWSTLKFCEGSVEYGWNMGGITSTNIDYATWGFLISTAALTVITYYYARQTRNLSRNQFRPYCYALLHPTTTQGLSLFIRRHVSGSSLLRLEAPVTGQICHWLAEHNYDSGNSWGHYQCHNYNNKLYS
jgi:hypothetical protein